MKTSICSALACFAVIAALLFFCKGKIVVDTYDITVSHMEQSEVALVSKAEKNAIRFDLTAVQGSTVTTEEPGTLSSEAEPEDSVTTMERTTFAEDMSNDTAESQTIQTTAVAETTTETTTAVTAEPPTAAPVTETTTVQAKPAPTTEPYTKPVPVATTTEPVTEPPTMSVPKPNGRYGTYGRLEIPDIGYSAALYDCNDYDGDYRQAIVNNTDSACFFYFNGSSVGYIGDHANQGFWVIRNVIPGSTKAYILFSDGSVKTLLCRRLDRSCLYCGDYLLDSQGINVVDLEYDFCMVTCNDTWSDSITIAFFDIV